MKKSRVRLWFLEPMNKHSNEVLVKGLNDSSEEFLLIKFICEDGERHSLVECKKKYVIKAQNVRKSDDSLRFRIWYKDPFDAIRFWKFDRTGKILPNKK